MGLADPRLGRGPQPPSGIARDGPCAPGDAARACQRGLRSPSRAVAPYIDRRSCRQMRAMGHRLSNGRSLLREPIDERKCRRHPPIDAGSCRRRPRATAARRRPRLQRRGCATGRCSRHARPPIIAASGPFGRFTRPLVKNASRPRVAVADAAPGCGGVRTSTPSSAAVGRRKARPHARVRSRREAHSAERREARWRRSRGIAAEPMQRAPGPGRQVGHFVRMPGSERMKGHLRAAGKETQADAQAELRRSDRERQRLRTGGVAATVVVGGRASMPSKGTRSPPSTPPSPCMRARE
jgi:hypothetical protein